MQSIPSIEAIPGTANQWRLRAPWRMRHADTDLIIPPGFVTDLASIPKLARSLVQQGDRRTWGPSIEHDYRYYYQIGPRRTADSAFRQRLRQNGISIAKSWMMWLAVRLGGYRAWSKNKQ